MSAEQDKTSTFIARWQGVTASELSTAQSFVIELCELLEVPRPHATPEHADFHAGRVIDEIERQGRLENTLIFYVWGDNGSSAEGLNGTISEQLAQNGIPTKIEQHLRALDELGGLEALGGPKTDNMYHAAWAWAGSTPYRSTKLVAAHFGGTRQPMAVSWPAGIKPDATPRAQFHHVIDVAPTIYELTKITPPRVVNGVPQDSIDGVSLAYTFADMRSPAVSSMSSSRAGGCGLTCSARSRSSSVVSPMAEMTTTTS